MNTSILRTLKLLAIVLSSWGATVEASSTLKTVVVAASNEKLMQKTIKFNGRVINPSKALISAGIGGLLTWVIAPGETVKKGQLLAQIDDVKYKLQQRELNVRLEQIGNQLTQLKNEASRLEVLDKIDSIDKKSLEAMLLDVSVKEQELEIYQVRLAAVKDKLAKCRVTSPIDGIVVSRLKNTGSAILENTLIASVVDSSDMQIVAYPSSRYLSSFTPGVLVLVKNNHIQTEGRIKTLIPVYEDSSQTFEMRIQLESPQKNAFHIGEVVTLEYKKEFEHQGSLIHRDSLIFRENSVYVFSVDDNGNTFKHEVKVGEGVGSWVSVTPKLDRNVKVVIRGAETLSDAEKVKVLRPEQLNIKI